MITVTNEEQGSTPSTVKINTFSLMQWRSTEVGVIGVVWSGFV